LRFLVAEIIFPVEKLEQLRYVILTKRQYVILPMAKSEQLRYVVPTKRQ